MLYLVDIGIDIENIVVCWLWENRMNSIIVTYWCKLGNVRNWHVIYSVGYLKVIAWNIMNYGMKNVIRNVKWNPEIWNDMIMQNDKKWVYLVLCTWYELGWIFLRLENLKRIKKAMGRHGVTKWVFEKENVDFGPKDPGLICRLAGVLGGNFETVGRWKQVGGESS